MGCSALLASPWGCYMGALGANESCLHGHAWDQSITSSKPLGVIVYWSTNGGLISLVRVGCVWGGGGGGGGGGKGMERQD